MRGFAKKLFLIQELCDHSEICLFSDGCHCFGGLHEGIAAEPWRLMATLLPKLLQSRPARGIVFTGSCKGFARVK